MAEAEGSSPLLLPPPLPPPLGMAEVEAPTAAETDKKQLSGAGSGAMDVERSRFPYCVVWTPIPVLTRLLVTSCTQDILLGPEAQNGSLVGTTLTPGMSSLEGPPEISPHHLCCKARQAVCPSDQSYFYSIRSAFVRKESKCSRKCWHLVARSRGVREVGSWFALVLQP
ncbi:transmembrane protein 222 isoform X3 [Bos indicus]|uniref:Transmembrane protein 222 isoform X3 n=1 Tax=Bos indicus TaxID=9915 RepID=A0ABM4R8E1_BOSIN|nr:transmembrane protein 222 isoform X2 [Bos indicus x Bos taurus]